MKIKAAVLPVMALGIAGVFLGPQQEQAEGFSLLGFSLNTGQRDIRVFNNFLDSQANNNQTPNANFPGYQGADMAIWKAAVEWGSELHGDGSGDPHQGNLLGSGGANFDPSWQGNATSTGTSTQNIMSALDANGGGTYAFIESPASNGWRGRYYENWTWSDGPGGTSSQPDLQGIATHEYGHSLGLGHASGTMSASTSVSGSDNQRSIENDDINGIRAIYGVKSATKPRITSVAVNNGVATIVGEDFSNTGNDVWFTQAASGGTGTPVKALNVPSTNGGTQITVTIPGAAGPGDVLVQKNASGHSSLSNAWPIDPGDDTGPPPPSGLAITNITPTSVQAVEIDGPVTVNLTGGGFFGIQTVTVDGQVLSQFPAEYAVVDDNNMWLNMPQVSSLGSVDVVLDDGTDTATTQIIVAASVPPTLDLLNSEPAFLFSALGATARIGALPNSVVLLYVSPELVPTSVPGLAEFGIGNNFTSLFGVAGALVPPQGWVEWTFPITSAAPGATFYWQAGQFFIDFPLSMTNIQKTVILL